MKCSRCNKEATTHFYQNINGQVTETWLCPDCAEQMGIGGMFSGFSGFGDFGSIGGFGAFDDLLGSFFGTAPAKALPKQTRCSVCGSSFSDIVKNGKAGCPDCYEQFAVQFRPTIEKIHGHHKHMGKMPGKNTPQITKTAGSAEKPAAPAVKKEETVDMLKVQLKKAVAAEEYEKAAQLRDRIRAMEGQK